MLSVPGQKIEYLEAFNHFNIGTSDYRIKKFIDKINRGLTDWTVSEITEYIFDEPERDEQGYAYVKVEVDYNVYGRNIDRAVLVIYARDVSGNWHIFSSGDNGAEPEGGLNDSKIQPIYGTSGRDEAETITVTASCYFPPSSENDPGHISSVEYCLSPLKPDQKKVPLSPKGGFGLQEAEQ